MTEKKFIAIIEAEEELRHIIDRLEYIREPCDCDDDDSTFNEDLAIARYHIDRAQDELRDKYCEVFLSYDGRSHDYDADTLLANYISEINEDFYSDDSRPRYADAVED